MHVSLEQRGVEMLNMQQERHDDDHPSTYKHRGSIGTAPVIQIRDQLDEKRRGFSCRG